MSNSLQSFLLTAIPTATKDLVAAFEKLPIDKRDWSPMGDARSALDQVAEIAILNGSVANIIESKRWPEGYDMSRFPAEKAAVMERGWEHLQELLHENMLKVVDAISAVDENDYDHEVQMPWGPMTMPQILSYPYWNTIYHQGQINYIASMLGCLD